MLTTLAAVKTHLGITDTGEDALLTQLISQGSAWIGDECNRTLTRETRTAEKYTGKGWKSLDLELYPVKSVDAVTIDGVTVTDYTITAATGRLCRDIWPKDAEIAVTYTGGYLLTATTNPVEDKNLPQNLEFACIVWVATARNTRDSEHLSDEAIGPLKSVFWSEQPTIKAIVEKYRRVSI